MTRLLLTGGRIIDPACGRDSPGDLLIEDDHIAAVGDVGVGAEAGTVLDCAGLLVVPGLIDLHVHLREAPFSKTGDDFADDPELEGKILNANTVDELTLLYNTIGGEFQQKFTKLFTARRQKIEKK